MEKENINNSNHFFEKEFDYKNHSFKMIVEPKTNQNGFDTDRWYSIRLISLNLNDLMGERQVNADRLVDMINNLEQQAKKYVDGLDSHLIGGILRTIGFKSINKNNDEQKESNNSVLNEIKLLYDFCSYLEKTTNIKPFIHKEKIIKEYLKIL